MIPFYAQQIEIEHPILANPTYKTEMLSIIVGYLESLGYEKSATILSEESGVNTNFPGFEKIQDLIMNAKFHESIEEIVNLKVDQIKTKKCVFEILSFVFVGLLAEKNLMEAIKLLRGGLSENCTDQQQINFLSGIILCKDKEELFAKTLKNPHSIEGRKKLVFLVKSILGKIQTPHKRLDELIAQAVKAQIIEDKYFVSFCPEFSLVSNHHTDLPNLPRYSSQTLKESLDEVLIVKYSNSGDLIAAISKDLSLLVWSEISHGKYNLKLKKNEIHGKPVNNIIWSNDDSKILTVSDDTKAIVWSSSTGEKLKDLSGHSDKVMGGAWLSEDQMIITGGIDSNIFLWNSAGIRLNKIENKLRVTDLLYTGADLNKIVIVSASSYIINVIDLETKAIKTQIQEKDWIFCSVISKKVPNHLLTNVSLKFPEIHLWDIVTGELLNRYAGHKQENYVIRMCFGGLHDEFIAAGSEDGRFPIWHINVSKPLGYLNEHKICVNSVDWNPKHPELLISASDDFSVKIWSHEEVQTKIDEEIDPPLNDISILYQ